MVEEFWNRLASLPKPTLTQLFADDAERVGALTLKQGGLLFDFSKTHLDAASWPCFPNWLWRKACEAKREALFSGAVVNPTEGRAAEHIAERGNGRRSGRASQSVSSPDARAD